MRYDEVLVHALLQLRIERGGPPQPLTKLASSPSIALAFNTKLDKACNDAGEGHNRIEIRTIELAALHAHLDAHVQADPIIPKVHDLPLHEHWVAINCSIVEAFGTYFDWTR